jgi:Bacterial archaeo-eukaryotic release factor family 10
MIGTPLDRLRRHSDPSGALLSVFVTVPPDPAALREFPARLNRLLATARMTDADDGARRRARAALARVREAGSVRGRDWFGHSVAVIASADAGVLDAMRLPCAVPDRAVFGRRAYVRLPLRAFQQCRPYAVVVIDRRRAWLFEVGGGTIRPVRRFEDEGMRNRSHAGWHGLDEYGVRHHAAELARRHYDATAAALAKLCVKGHPFVVGGHSDGVAEFLSSLSPPLRSNAAGTFVIDPHTMTPDDVRAHAEAVMADREPSAKGGWLPTLLSGKQRAWPSAVSSPAP